jgi:hypothetical protein
MCLIILRKTEMLSKEFSINTYAYILPAGLCNGCRCSYTLWLLKWGVNIAAIVQSIAL